MENKEKGYVYILTNPSFREDWIKIGKTGRPVDVRSKELDNTAVPLPFEVYAQIKTEKWEELEDTIHKNLTRLTDKRIRPNREFYNIKPEEALETIRDICRLIDDAEIFGPEQDDEEDGPITRTNKGKYRVDYDGEFYLKSSNGMCDSKMRIIDGKYVVLEGSIIDPTITSHTDQIQKLRKKHSNCVSNNVVIENVAFNSPPTAGQFVKGGATNGKTYWRTDRDEPLENFIHYLKDECAE